TPSPFFTSPKPVSHADRTAHSTPARFIAATSSAVKIPSSLSGPAVARRFAPARANPDMSNGFSCNAALAGFVRFGEPASRTKRRIVESRKNLALSHPVPFLDVYRDQLPSNL